MTITLGVIEYSLKNPENRKEILANLKKYVELEGTYISNSKENNVKIGIKAGYTF